MVTTVPEQQSTAPLGHNFEGKSCSSIPTWYLLEFFCRVDFSPPRSDLSEQWVPCLLRWAWYVIPKQVYMHLT